MLNDLQLNHQRERDFAVAEALRLASVRDDLNNRYLFGLAAFNAAAIVALFTALGTAGGLLAFGLDPATLKAAIAFFVVGVVFAAVAITATQNNLVIRAGATAARATALSTLIDVSASHRADDGSYSAIAADRDQLFTESLKPSNVAINCQALSGAAWLAGVAMPIGKLLGFHELLGSWF